MTTEKGTPILLYAVFLSTLLSLFAWAFGWIFSPEIGRLFGFSTFVAFVGICAVAKLRQTDVGLGRLGEGAYHFSAAMLLLAAGLAVAQLDDYRAGANWTRVNMTAFSLAFACLADVIELRAKDKQTLVGLRAIFHRTEKQDGIQ